MMNNVADQRSLQSWLRLWRWVLVGSCVGMAVVVLAGSWVVSGLYGQDLHPVTTIALLLGTTAATALGVVLMGLLFYSERVQDDDASSN